MSLICQMLEHYRSLLLHLREEVQMVEDGKLTIIRNGKNYTGPWVAELRERAAKIDGILKMFEDQKHKPDGGRGGKNSKSD